eukprot:gene843-1050_t
MIDLSHKEDDEFKLVVKGKKNKVNFKSNNNNNNVKHSNTSKNETKKNNEIRDKYLSQLQSNAIPLSDNNNNINQNKRIKKRGKNELVIRESSNDEKIEKVTSCLNQYKLSIEKTDFFKEIITLQSKYTTEYNKVKIESIFSNIHDIICYGIGDFSSSKKCQEQLSFILTLTSLYKITGSIYIFDPIMNEVEKRVVEQLGFKVLENNEEGKRKISQFDDQDNKNNYYSLFYMPFCGRKLYDNVLWANWENLTRVVIIGNSFSLYNDPLNKPDQSYLPFSYTTKINGLFSEIPFPNNYPTKFIFHDLSIHLFPKNVLDSKDENYFKHSEHQNPEPPKLFDPEIYAKTATSKKSKKLYDPRLAGNYYTFRKDLRRCAFPRCGGYFLKEVNQNRKEIYTPRFNFDTPVSMNKSLVLDAAPNTVVVFGYFLNGDFRMVEAFKMIPPASRSAPEITPDCKYYFLKFNGVVCITEPCPSYDALLLNINNITTTVLPKHDIYSTGHVDQSWYIDKAINNANMVHLISDVSGETELPRIVRSFVKIPDPQYPCPPVEKTDLCVGNQVQVYTRDRERCYQSDGCVASGFCILSIPVCNPGYTLISFPGRPNGCPIYYCDADFLDKTSYH